MNFSHPAPSSSWDRSVGIKLLGSLKGLTQMELIERLSNVQYVYLGTTQGWPGNSCLRQIQITCATTDPLVATLFAIHARNHGQAIVVAVRRGLLAASIGSPNFFSVIESAVNFRLAPVEFGRIAEITLNVDRSIDILKDLGFQDIPVRLRDVSALRQELAESHESGVRLNDAQIYLFNDRMFETEP